MHYGRPKIFAMQAISRYSLAILRDAVKQIHMIRRPLFCGAALLGLVISSIIFLGLAISPEDNDLFGHYALKKVYRETVVIDGKRFRPSVAETLRSGHRCQEWMDVDSASHTNCLDSRGKARTTAVNVSDKWDTSCCVAVVLNSDTESLAKWRRFFSWTGFPSTPSIISIAIMFVFLSLGAALFMLVSAVFYTAIFVPFSLMSASMNTANAIFRLLAVVIRASRSLTIETWVPPALDGRAVLMTHVSDLHVSLDVPYELQVNPCEYGGIPSEMKADRLYSRLSDVLCGAVADRPAALVMTGDLTDTGTLLEWDRLIDIARKSITAGYGAPVVIAIPGNHDVSLNVGEKPDVSGNARLQREEIMSRYTAIIENIFNPDKYHHARNRHPERRNIVMDGNTIHVISLDSCRYRSRFILSNAIGQLGKVQLGWLDTQLRVLQGPLVILMHHHLALSRDRLTIRHPIEAAMELLKLPVDVRSLTKLLLEYSRHPGNHVLVLHGHQHEELRYAVRDELDGCISVSGLASSTMGGLTQFPNDQQLRLDGIPRYARIGFDPNVGWLIELRMLKKPELLS